MGNDNRDRITVALGGPWWMYQGPQLPGWEIVGTVRRDNGDAGALARSRTGQWVQLNAGAARSLDQRKVAAAIAAAEGEEK
jgi:hypothetical protein